MGFSDKFLGTMMCYLVNLFGVVTGVVQIDALGRRKLMLLGGVGRFNNGSSILAPPFCPPPFRRPAVIRIR